MAYLPMVGSDNEISFEDVTSQFTLNSNITYISGNTWFKRYGNTVYFQIRGTFPSNVYNSYNIFIIPSSMSLMIGETFALYSTNWANPEVIGFCSTSPSSNRCDVNGAPDEGGKSFLVNGHMLFNMEM